MNHLRGDEEKKKERRQLDCSLIQIPIDDQLIDKSNF